jgi:hypothetical protein
VKGLLHEVPLKHERSDDDMNGRSDDSAGVKPKPAAVWCPIVLREPEVTVLHATHRSSSSHGGQVAFLGRIDADDEDDCRSCEAEEETGLARALWNLWDFSTAI